MNNAEKDKVEEQDLVYTQRLQNEYSEAGLGFTSSANGVLSPSGVNLGVNERSGLALLGRPTNSVTQGTGDVLLLCPSVHIAFVCSRLSQTFYSPHKHSQPSQMQPLQPLGWHLIHHKADQLKKQTLLTPQPSDVRPKNLLLRRRETWTIMLSPMV